MNVVSEAVGVHELASTSTILNLLVSMLTAEARKNVGTTAKRKGFSILKLDLDFTDL